MCVGKSQQTYERLLKAVLEACEAIGISADPATVVTDFESAAINAVTATLGDHVAVRGCFFHLCQSTWRKIQELGLVQAYRSDKEVRTFCASIDALAFLPISEVDEGVKHLLDNIPAGDSQQELTSLLDYFQSTYVSGTFRRITRPTGGNGATQVRLRRIPPLFPKATWNVFEATLAGTDRTNNLCESWNRGFTAVVGHQHPSLWTAVEALQEDAAAATTVLLQNARGQPPAKRVKRATLQLQRQLQTLCRERRDGRRSVADTLRAVSHTVRFE